MLYVSIVLGIVALVAWSIAYFAVFRPKLETYRLTSGIYAKINAVEHSFFDKLSLRSKGLKVVSLGFLASMMPIVGPMVEALNGLKWDSVFPTETAAVIAFIFGFLVAVLPFVMTILHFLRMDEAVRTVPTPVDASAPVVSVDAVKDAREGIAPAAAIAAAG